MEVFLNCRCMYSTDAITTQKWWSETGRKPITCLAWFFSRNLAYTCFRWNSIFGGGRREWNCTKKQMLDKPLFLHYVLYLISFMRESFQSAWKDPTADNSQISFPSLFKTSLSPHVQTDLKQTSSVCVYISKNPYQLNSSFLLSITSKTIVL